MAELLLSVEIRFAWWFEPYLYGVALFCQIHGTTPDLAKIESTARRAARFRFPGGRWVRLFP